MDALFFLLKIPGVCPNLLIHQNQLIMLRRFYSLMEQEETVKKIRGDKRLLF